MKTSKQISFVFILSMMFSITLQCQVGTVLSFQKISDTQGNFAGGLSPGDAFSRIASIGDLDNDGINDIAVGAYGDDDGGSNHGAVWVLFLNENGTAKNHSKISSTSGNFFGNLDDGDFFGYSVAGIGDINGDGIEDIAVGALYDDDGGNNRGAVYILFLNTDGTVNGHQKISSTYGNFTGALQNDDFFGISISGIGDLNNDGIPDIAVGATGTSDGGNTKSGALWILFLQSNGKVLNHQKISATHGGFTVNLAAGDRFGRSCTILGDLDQDGNKDILVGAHFDDDGGLDRGCVYVLFLNSNGSVKSHQKISDISGNFTGGLQDNDQFGVSSTTVGDIDGDGIVDVIVGAHMDDDGGADKGAVWVLFLNNDGTVKNHQKISSTQGGFTGDLDHDDLFGATVAFIGDINNDNNIEIAVGAVNDDDGGTNQGAVWILSLETVTSPLVNIDIRVFLEGPYTGTIMSPLLNLLGHLPLSQPYNTPPWNYPGTEAVSALPSVTVVDWILVEMRQSTGSAATATIDSVIAQQAGFLMTDGFVRNLTGNGYLTINHEVTGNLYAVVRHRNHLDVMSAYPLTLQNGVYVYDFTTDVTQAYGGINGYKHLGNGVYGMAGGDGDGNGQVQNQDKHEVWAVQSGLSGYYAGDFDMNGQVQNQDKFDIWQVNVGKGSQVVITAPGIK